MWKITQETFKQSNVQDLMEGFSWSICVPDVTCGMLSEKAGNLTGESYYCKKQGILSRCHNTQSEQDSSLTAHGSPEDIS